MSLIVVIGSSGSGKTTFLTDVHKQHDCIYLRQFHSIRPYITVTSIPQFDPKLLPFWDMYEREGKAEKIKVGGTLSGKFTAGLSGGQRKLLLFEIICQRVEDLKDLLIVLDEPFAGVTDEFVPFVTERLAKMKQNHNVLIVTNDHTEALTNLADHTIQVSAIDRSSVTVSSKDGSCNTVARNSAVSGLFSGSLYRSQLKGEDLEFFANVEIKNDLELRKIIAFAVVSYSLFVVAFWDSPDSAAPLVLIAGGLIHFMCMNPLLVSLVEWKSAMVEEAEALVHASRSMNRILKLAMCLVLIIAFAAIEFLTINAIVDGKRNGFDTPEFFVAMLFDAISNAMPLIVLGLFTNLTFQAVQILGTLPFLFMIFFSSTYSPGHTGVPGIKGLRYLFARFYYFCRVPSLFDTLDTCPVDPVVNMILLIFTSLLTPILIFLCIAVNMIIHRRVVRKTQKEHSSSTDADHEFMSSMYLDCPKDGKPSDDIQESCSEV